MMVSAYVYNVDSIIKFRAEPTKTNHAMRMELYLVAIWLLVSGRCDSGVRILRLLPLI